MSEKWVQLNCAANGCTILGSGKTSAKRTILKRLRREKPRAELRLQLSTQRGHYLLPILGPLLLHHVLPDAPPHVPIERGKARIHGPRYAFAGVQDQFPQVSEGPNPRPALRLRGRAGSVPAGQRAGVDAGRRTGVLPHYSANFKIIPVSVATHSEPLPAARNMARTAVAR